MKVASILLMFVINSEKGVFSSLENITNAKKYISKMKYVGLLISLTNAKINI